MLYLFHAVKQEDGNSQQINSVIVESAVSESDALAVAQEAQPLGCEVKASWEAVSLGDGTLAAPVFIRGRVVIN